MPGPPDRADARAAGRPDADVAAYAMIVARLAHRFADRAGVLEVRGFDEASFSRMEHDVLSHLRQAAASGDAASIASFARALVDARETLLGPAEDALDPITIAAPSTGDGSSYSSAGPTVETPPPAHHDPISVDVLDLMETLHSKGAGRPPSST